MSNSNLTQVQNKPKFSVAITTPAYQKLINNTIGDPNRAKRFVSAITSAVAVNKELQNCDAGSILAGALLGESLNLSPSPQMGQYYLLPFKNNKENIVQAQFVLGYKGYIQLALRSGAYRELDAMCVKQGEYLGKDSMTGKPKFSFVEDDDERDLLPTVGYMACFEYLNGFRKVIYWSKEKMLSHADKYSQAFSKTECEIKSKYGVYQKVSFEDYEAGKYDSKDEWMYSSYWYKDFDGMALKTMLRQLISKWGVMSTEMQMAMDSDSTVNEFSSNNDIISVDTSEDANNAAEPLTDAAHTTVIDNRQIQPEATDVVKKIDLSSL